MFSCKALIIKSPAIDRETSCSVSIGNVTSLNHKAINYSMKFAVLIAEFWLGGARIVSGAEASKILRSFRSEVCEELKNDSASTFGADLYVHINFGVDFGTHSILLL